MKTFQTLLAITLILLAGLTGRAQEPTKPGTETVTAKGQKPSDQKPVADKAQTTGTIKGQLVASDGQPFTNANVMVQSLTQTPAAKPARADAEGNFVFEELPPGSYLVIATAPGYIDESTAVSDYTQWPRHLIGSNVKLNMIRGGVITGMVSNTKGEPMVAVPVRATLISLTPSSVLGLITGASNSETDDRGIYRIYGLLPGQYVVSAGGSGRFGQFSASGFDSDASTFYPSGTRDTTVPVTVRSGDETSAIDIKYRGTEGHTISGTILGDIPVSVQAGAVTVFLAHTSSSSILSVTIVGTADPRRSFSFNGVADGEYDLMASFLADPKTNALMSTKHVVVRGGDVTGLELRLATLASVSGTIALDPIKPEDKCDKRNSQLVEIFLSVPRDEARKSTADSMLAMMGGGLSVLDETGEFAMRNLPPGKYRLEIKLPSDSWYVRAINIPTTRTTAPGAQPGAANVAPSVAGWQGTLTVKPGDQISGASIFVGQDAAGLRGRLSTDGAIREGTTVHLVPIDREQANNVLRYGETIVKSDGSFALRTVAPGRYFILPRVEGAVSSDTWRRPISWDATTRLKLRHEAETTNTIVELKPCQRVIDYDLKP